MPEQIQAPYDRKEVLAQINAHLKQLDALTPHVNQAQAAFGGFDEHMQRITDLRNKLEKAKAALSQPA